MRAGLILFGLATLVAACNPAATITLESGDVLRREILAESTSDPDNLHVVGRDETAALIPRAQVVDIDHPGEVTAIICGAVAAFGVWLAVDGLAEYDACDNFGCEVTEVIQVVGGAGIALGFAIPAVSGLSVYLTSVTNAQPPDAGSTMSALGPLVGAERAGLGLRARWQW